MDYNNWSGIDNDAEIFFEIYNAGLEKYAYKKDFEIKSNINSGIYLNDNYISIFNFSENGYGNVSSSKRINSLNPGSSFDLSFIFSYKTHLTIITIEALYSSIY